MVVVVVVVRGRVVSVVGSDTLSGCDGSCCTAGIADVEVPNTTMKTGLHTTPGRSRQVKAGLGPTCLDLP